MLSSVDNENLVNCVSWLLNAMVNGMSAEKMFLFELEKESILI